MFVSSHKFASGKMQHENMLALENDLLRSFAFLLAGLAIRYVQGAPAMRNRIT